MNTVIEQMLSNYEINNIEDEKNAIKEILQEIILSALSKVGFFQNAVFCGGTALRIFYRLERFSEDLDFSLVSPDSNFNIDKYLPRVVESVKEYGLNLELQTNRRNDDKVVKSAFLKANTVEQLLYFNSSFDIKGIRKEEKIKIKLEVDTNPPAGGEYETKMGILPEIYDVKIYDSKSLFAGKIHSILCRFWDNRVKGRDLYDFLFYIARNTKVNTKFLENAMKQSGHLKEDDYLDLPKIKELLKNKFNELDYRLAVEDTLPFIKNKKELDKWGKELFVAVTDMINE